MPHHNFQDFQDGIDVFDDEDNDYILLVLGVLAAVLLVVIPGFFRDSWWGQQQDEIKVETTEAAASADDDLFERTRAALDAGDFADAGLEVNGTTALLTGVVANEALRAEAGEIAAGVEGVTAVDNQLTIADAAPTTTEALDVGPAEAVFAVDGSTITLTGQVADTETLDSLVALANDTVGEANVVNQLEVADQFAGTDVEFTGEVDAATAGQVRDGFGGISTITPVDALAEAAAPPETTTTTAEPNNELVASLNELVGLEPILFDTSQATIQAASIPTIDAAAEILTSSPDGSVRIEGHTDSDGAEAANLTLSQDRADAVLAALVDRGVDAGRLTAEGFGETRLAFDERFPENKAKNRRIEFVVG